MATLEQLYEICPVSRFRARHTLNVSTTELDELIRSSNGQLVDDLDTIIKVGDPDPDEHEPTSNILAHGGRCLWTIPLEDRE
jgi:hypothetical protein